MRTGEISAVAAWGHSLGISEATPEWLVAALAIGCIFCLVVLPAGHVIGYLDRKIGADLQARVGPNRAGFGGFFQPLADLMKLLQKESSRSWSWREIVWLAVHTMALYSTVAVLPLGSLNLLVDTDMSAFLPFWATLVLALGTMLMGFGRGTVSGWFGGVRVAAQALAGALPALICLICVGIRVGNFHWSAIAHAQSAAPWNWNFVADPFLFLAFVVFVISGLVLLAIPPMDGALSVSDLHGGVASGLHGPRLGLFHLGRFYGFFLWSVITVVLFLGGWALPFHLSDRLRESEALQALQLLELFWLLLKALGLMLVVVWVARVNPRSRVDQITDFAWKVLSPVALFALIGTAVWTTWRALS